jgi:hypothetical protein
MSIFTITCWFDYVVWIVFIGLISLLIMLCMANAVAFDTNHVHPMQELRDSWDLR